MGLCSVTMVSFGSTVSQWTTDYRRPLCVTLELWFHAILQCLNEPLGQWGSKTSQWPLGSTKLCRVTMVSFGSRVSQWTTDDMRPPMSQRTFGFLGPCSVTKASWFHEAPQNHNGPLGSVGTPRVTMVSRVP